MSISDKLTIIAENMQGVYEAGKQAQQNEFMDSYQNYGNREWYNHGFCGCGWNNYTFKPNHSMKPVHMSNMFVHSCIEGSLKTILENRKTPLDTSKSTGFSYAFHNTKFTELPTISLESVTNYADLHSIFAENDYLVTIEKLIMPKSLPFPDSYYMDSMFRGTPNLENLTIEGKINFSYFNVQYCTKLTKESTTSIINALSATTSGLSVGISKSAVNKAFETGIGLKDGSTSQEWRNLIATKRNWTISLYDK